jgi:hypothetical protein
VRKVDGIDSLWTCRKQNCSPRVDLISVEVSKGVLLGFEGTARQDNQSAL